MLPELGKETLTVQTFRIEEGFQIDNGIPHLEDAEVCSSYPISQNFPGCAQFEVEIQLHRKGGDRGNADFW